MTGIDNQVRNQVFDQVYYQVLNQVKHQVCKQVRDRVRNRVLDQVWSQVWNQVRDQALNRFEEEESNDVIIRVWNIPKKIFCMNEVFEQVDPNVSGLVWKQIKDLHLLFSLQVRDKLVTGFMHQEKDKV